MGTEDRLAYDITYALDLFNGNRDAAESLEVLQILARALMAIDIESLQCHPDLPLIYRSGVRYQAEPARQERWQDIPTTLRRQQGDCEDLACWRAAELNARFGVPARPQVIVTRVLSDGRRLYHVIVRMPDGSVEDPSFLLGMRGSSPNTFVSMPWVA
jgi:hypothetical protein